MPAQSLDAIVLSQRGLARELLGELLIARFGAHIAARCASLDEARAQAHAGQLLICDVQGFSAAALAAFLAHLRGEHAALRVVTIDDSLGNCSVDDIIRAVLASGGPTPDPHEALTPIEMEVMLAVAAGGRNAEIARRMRRSSKTVEKHRANALRKLGVRNVAQLTAYVIRHRLLNGNSILNSRSSA